MKKRQYIALICLFLFSLLVGFGAGGEIPISKQENLYSSLLGIASIVFGIMGAWVAIVYPEALTKVFKKENNVSSLTERVRRLFIPLRVSLLVVSVCLLYPWVASALRALDFFDKFADHLRIASFSLGFFLVSLTLLSLIYTFLNIDESEAEIEKNDKALKGSERRTRQRMEK